MKYFRIFICVLLFAVLAVNIVAEANNSYTFDYKEENITVTFESQLSEESCKEISDFLVYGNKDARISTLSFCWLFGHNLTTSNVIVIKHEVNPISPRCLRETHEVKTCSKCDYMEDEIISSVYISCHPET